MSPIRIGRGDRRGVLGRIVGQENNNERRATNPRLSSLNICCLDHHDVFNNSWCT